MDVSLYVVYKNVSIDVSTIGVCSTNDEAKKLCEKDYDMSEGKDTDDGKSVHDSRLLYYTIEEYVLNTHYPSGVARLIDYVPTESGPWSEMTIHRNTDFISFIKEDNI